MSDSGYAVIVWRRAYQDGDGHWTEDSERWCVRDEYAKAYALYERFRAVEPAAEWEWVPDDEWTDASTAAASLDEWLLSARKPDTATVEEGRS